MTQSEALTLRLQHLLEQLRFWGYDVSLVYGDCFDVLQEGIVHNLARAEAHALIDATERDQKMLELKNWIKLVGPLAVYTFTQESEHA